MYEPKRYHCSHCGKRGLPGGFCTVCKTHWHGEHRIEDCEQEIREREEPLWPTPMRKEEK